MIPKEYSEPVNRRRTDNTVDKRKRTNDLQHTTQKTKDRTLIPGVKLLAPEWEMCGTV